MNAKFLGIGLAISTSIPLALQSTGCADQNRRNKVAVFASCCGVMFRLFCVELPNAHDGASAKSLWGKGFFGAGEGIRTLDPDLGKVVLYP
jgi:hypothetical protein